MKGMKLSVVVLFLSVLSLILFVSAQIAVALLVGLTGGFWVGCAFFAVGIGSVIGFSLSAMRKEQPMFDFLLGIPVWKHSATYAVVAFVLAILFSALGQKVHGAIAGVVQALALVVYLFFILTAKIPQQTIRNIREEVRTKTTRLRLLEADAQLLANSCNDAAARTEALRLADALRYSDPMSHASLESIEGEIEQQIRLARTEGNAGDNGAVVSRCRAAEALLEERNLKCKILKS